MLVKPSYFGTYSDTQAIVVFRHDDTATDQWVNYALPVYQKYGIAGTFFVNTRVLADQDNLARFKHQIPNYIPFAKELILNGMEVASHFPRHYSLNYHTDPVVPEEGTVGWGMPMSEAELRLLLQEAVDDINSWGGARNGKVESVVTPWQEWNALAERVIPEYHTSSSNDDIAHGGCPNGPMAYPPSDYMQCQSVVIETTTSVEDVQQTILDCIKGRLFVQLMFHNIEPNDENHSKTQASEPLTWLDSQLETLCAWCEQVRLDCPAKIIFPQMRDATRYMKGQGDYDYRVASFSFGPLVLSNSFPFIKITFHAYNAAGEEILLSSVF